MPISGSQTPCLLVHGLTASPTQLDPVRRALEAAGYPVVAPLLSGHGTRVEDLFALRWEDWYADVTRAADSLLRTQDSGPRTFFFVGMSLGALLGLKLAIDRPDILRGMVCIGTPLTMFPWMRLLYPAINYTPLRWVIRKWPKNYEFAVADPVGREVYRQSSYPHFPLPAVGEVRRLQAVVRRDLGQIKTPLLLLHSRKDSTAPPEAMAIIAKAAPASVEQVWLERSQHVATLDYEKEEIASRAVKFFQRRGE